MDWGGANSRVLGLVSVWTARSLDQTALRPSVIKGIRQNDVKYITYMYLRKLYMEMYTHKKKRNTGDPVKIIWHP